VWRNDCPAARKMWRPEDVSISARCVPGYVLHPLDHQQGSLSEAPWRKDAGA
jgi:hypothetical protein